MAQQRKSAHAVHRDRRTEQRREKYGELADLTVGELQQRAAEEGVPRRSQMRKDELLRALSGRKR